MLTRTDGGLIVPQDSFESAVATALREHDPDLRLVPQGRDREGRTFYKVARYIGSERPVEFILTWGDITNGIAYPLSWGIVDEVKRHDRGSRGFDARDSDAINAEHRAELEKESRRQSEALLDDHRDRISGKKITAADRVRGHRPNRRRF